MKKYLKYRGIPYEEYNIEKDEAAREECRRLSGDTIVPVTTADGKDFAVSYDREKLDKSSGLRRNFIRNGHSMLCPFSYFCLPNVLNSTKIIL